MRRHANFFERLKTWLWSRGEPVRRQILLFLMLVAGALAVMVFAWSVQMTFQIATRSSAPAPEGLPSVPESLRASAHDFWQFVRSVFTKPARETPAPQKPDLAPHKLPTAQ
ncbi:hypothetical protein HYW67_03615 [Candidatus Parcubacteria bacterium]|nr:hypothetical protein [Candidatus Parcubacteria bacterium]